MPNSGLPFSGAVGLPGINLNPSKAIIGSKKIEDAAPTDEEAITIAAINLDSAQEYDVSDSSSSAEEALA